VRLRPAASNDPEFLNYLLNDPAILQTARREAIPSLHQANLNPTRYGRLQIAVPPLTEQLAIVANIAAATAILDITMKNAERELALLREYRTRLIVDVVTGKLDVREAAFQLPQQAAEPEHLDEVEDLPQDEETAEDAELEAEETV
jgi:type I restriction enzyme S subunit